MTVLLVIVHVIVCLVLVLVILLQAGRGQGFGGTSLGFGGGVQTLFGTKAADFLTKATSVCAILFLITCISLDIIEARRARSIVRPGGGEKAVSKEDIAKIKEALEKLKAEAAQQKTATPSGTATTTAGPTTTASPTTAKPEATQTTTK